MAVLVLQWRDSKNEFLESEDGLKKLLAARPIRSGDRDPFKLFSDCLAEQLEPVAQMIAAEFAKAHMPVEIVVLWCVMRHSGLPHFTLDFCVREGGIDERVCYRISRREAVLSFGNSAQVTQGLLDAWLEGLRKYFTEYDSELRLAIRELGSAFSRRRTLPMAVRAAASLLAGRRKAG